MKRFALPLLAILGAVSVTGILLCPDDPARSDERPRQYAPDRGSDHERARRALQAGEVVPLREILGKAETDFEAEMLEAELDEDDGVWVYELKMLTPSGSILKLKYNASTKILEKARGHDLAQWYRGDPKVLAAVAPTQRRERWMNGPNGPMRGGDSHDARRHGPFGVLSWFGLNDEDDEEANTHPVTDDRTPE